ncbi:DinB family protein [Nesterenkonia sp. MY13]|uniref:DinB family protein n=1 Tax=Nesterenkonia sedimenti TaxID=1463632 RepID=A0A7X8TH77_9MICC|nr:DinB family protein [Nesterenkonia sedimenti]NLS08476.1 DinB family protein [Nesterenkonia sedimenti]
MTLHKPEESWSELLLDQLEWHWKHQVRDRSAGLSDAEYFWEPAPDCWNIRRRGASDAPVQGGAGEMVVEFAFPPPEPAPFTSIAWRLAHVVVGIFAMRNASHFGREATDYHSFTYAATAAEALEQLETEYARWAAGVRSLSDADLQRPCGEEGFEQEPMSKLVLHIHREVIHHLAEVALLRDIYLHTQKRWPTV